MPSSPNISMDASALVLDDEEVIGDLASLIFEFHERLSRATGLYSPEGDDETRCCTRGKIESVLSATFCTFFGSSPSDRFDDLFDQASYLA